MAVNLSGYTNYQNQNSNNNIQISGVQKEQGTEIPVSSSQTELTPGQVFSGEVVSIDGKDIQLLLDNNQLLNAKLDNDMNMVLGQILSFEVKSAAGNQTSLRPLYANLNQNPAVVNALNEAGMPQSTANLDMVSSMMKEGMPVNKSAIWNMAKTTAAYPGADPATLVQLTKLGMPIDELTIHQFENYKNFEHQIMKDVVDLTEGLSKLPMELFEEGKTEQGFSDSQQIFQMLGMDEQNAGSELAKQVLNHLIGELPVTETGAGEAFDMAGLAVGKDSIFTEEQIKFFSQKLTELSVPVQEQNQLLSAENGKQLLNFIHTMVTAQNQQPIGKFSQTLQELLSSKELTTVMKEELTKQFVLNPEEIAKEGKVEELYRRITEQTARAAQILQGAGKEDGAAMKSAQNLNDNVNFMNQLNHVLTYVQLPLKMNQENTHGELYVYTNKKNLQKKDGNVSALLHLDMEHLGPMDVYVAMQNQKVSTHFYMQDVSTLDFIEQHIGMLDERLTKKGYQMNTTVTVKEGAQADSIAKEFLKNESGKLAPIASKLSFDVRA